MLAAMLITMGDWVWFDTPQQNIEPPSYIEISSLKSSFITENTVNVKNSASVMEVGEKEFPAFSDLEGKIDYCLKHL